MEEPMERWTNALTHGLGAVLALAGTALLVGMAAPAGDGWQLGAAIVFGVTLFLLYLASTLYHALPERPVLKTLDHAAIYLLIAGTYTPFSLVTLRHAGGVHLFAVIWTLAVVGVVLEATWRGRPRWLNALVFVAMGWLVLFMRAPLMAHLHHTGLWLLVAGGVTYTLGTIFYVMPRRYMHAVWHLFVLGGSTLHFMAVLLYVVR
jgi:hemolysin III